MLIESPHELGFRFNQDYYMVNWGWVKVIAMRRKGTGFVYEFQQVTG